MTTILVKDNKMYGDGQMTGNYVASYGTKKIVNFGSAIVGGAGRWSHVVKFHQWVYDNLLAEQAQQEHPYVTITMPEKMVDDDFLGLVLYPDGTVIQFEGCDNSYEVKQPIAIGSGAEFAIAAAWNGIDGEQCIRTAIHFDTGSGGEVQVEGFEEEVEISPEKLESLDKETLIRLITGEMDGEEFDELFGDGTVQEEGAPQSSDVIRFGNDSLWIDILKSGGFITSKFKEFAPMSSFRDRSFTLADLKDYADILNVTYPHNIDIGKIADKLDLRVHEIFNDLNK